MNRRLMILGAALMLTAPAFAPVFAHEEMRVIGTIAGQKGKVLEVKTRDGKTAHITIDDQTGITKDKATIPAADLKTGLFVVIDGYGDDLSDLQAIQIRVVPPPK